MSPTPRPRAAFPRSAAVAALLLGPLLGGPARPAGVTPPGGHARPDLIFILADDVGHDSLGPAPTPHIDALAARGIAFDRFYCQTLCSPTRINFLTGRQPLPAWGIGEIVDPAGANPNPATNPPLPVEELTVAEALKAAGYATAVFGKWHVTNETLGRDDAFDPNVQGFDAARAVSLYGVFDGYAGGTSTDPDDDWTRVDDGVTSQDHTYNTTAVTDAFVDWWRSTPSPKFAYVAYPAAHTPFHVPPAHLTSSPAVPVFAWQKHRAMIEAMDTEIGRALESVDTGGTVVFFAGDNGTPVPGVGPGVDPAKVKGSMHDGGVSPPFIASGWLLPGGRRTQALVEIGDLFATLVELAGGCSEAVPAESLSFVPVLMRPEEARGPRTHTVAARRKPNGFAGPFSIDTCMATSRDRKLVLQRTGGAVVKKLFAMPAETSVPLDPAAVAELEAVLAERGLLP